MSEAYGYNTPGDEGNDYNSVNAIVEQVLSRRHTATVVRITAVRAGSGAVGRVDMQPMVHQVDGQGGFMAHGQIFDAPYFRYQGGESAVVLDPKVGDIGIAVIANRDISTVKASQQDAMPETRRSMSLSDGMYLGGILNGVPTQFIKFTDDGIEVVSPKKFSVSAPEIVLSGNSVKHNGLEIGSTHTHGGVQTGGNKTSVPSA